jgi:hypothetical protein
MHAADAECRRRVEVIPDDEADIVVIYTPHTPSRALTAPSVEASRRLTAKYDFVVTSGGIGPRITTATILALLPSFSTILPGISFNGHRCLRTNVDDYLRLHVGRVGCTARTSCYVPSFPRLWHERCCSSGIAICRGRKRPGRSNLSEEAVPTSLLHQTLILNLLYSSSTPAR